MNDTEFARAIIKNKKLVLAIEERKLNELKKIRKSLNKLIETLKV